MADSVFFKNFGPFSLKQLAEISGARLSDQKAGEIVLADVASLDKAQSNHITFLDNEKYKSDLINTTAGACILRDEHADLAPKGLALLFSENPYKAYALVAQAFYPSQSPHPFISDKSVIHDSVSLGTGCYIAPGVVIRENAKIGNNVTIQENTVICEGVTIGDNCYIDSQVTISHAILGKGVRIFPGVRIGQDGFGFAIDPMGHVSVPQLGRVIIEDKVEIGANTTIDRGAGPDTVIGAGARIDNLVQIGHNVTIGKGVVIVAQAGVSGSSKIGDFAVLGGQTGVAGHLSVGPGAQIAAQSGVSKSVAAGAKMFGTPAQPIKQAWRALATLNRLAKKGT